MEQKGRPPVPSRKITIPINLCTFGWVFMAIGLTLGVLAGVDAGARYGWAGICIALIGKQLLNRSLCDHLAHRVDESADREYQAFQAGQRSSGLSLLQ